MISSLRKERATEQYRRERIQGVHMQSMVPDFEVYVESPAELFFS